ncbi:hypothetical protein MHBO_004433 [Bonamia ostreae]|uniref:DUF4224 domain-containing protein n=1 Tax=Bonamia ostreae TaxID=126728 RepID=A0ABV2ATT1_9EUKA
MDNTEFLTQVELVELTGCKQAGAQKRWLSDNDINFLVNTEKKPVVSRFYLRLKMAGAVPEEMRADKTELEHNFNFNRLKK